MKIIASLALTMALLPAAGSAKSGDFDPAAFVADKCTRCHGDEVYTRPDRRIKDLDRLHAQVRMCDANVGTRLFDEDLEAVVQYLNDNFYHFSH